MSRISRGSEEQSKLKSSQMTSSTSQNFSKSKYKLPQPLNSSQVYLVCKTSELPRFKNTNEIQISNEIYSQERATGAIELGLGIRKPGYNIFVSGVGGTGKTSVIRSFLEKSSKHLSAPSDWLYVHDFSGHETPKIIEMPSGVGKQYKKDIENLIKIFREKISETFRGEKFENNISSKISSANERKSKLFIELENFAKAINLEVRLTQNGIETSPVVEGKMIDEKDYYKLSPSKKEEIEANRSKLDPLVLEFVRQVRAIDNDTRKYIDRHRDIIAREIIKELSQEYLDKYSDIQGAIHHINSIQNSVIEDLFYFFYDDEESRDSDVFQSLSRNEEKDPFKKYKVNIFVDNTGISRGPIIIENNPTYYNLFGKIEKNVENGIYHTDFTMIKAGTVHRANGGYLVLSAEDLLANPTIWDTLKRVLRSQQAFIEDMGEQYSLLPTSGLRPEAMPLDIKVIIIGNDEIYHALFHMDMDFAKIFKIKADFDHKMERNKANIKSYIRFIATRSSSEGLLAFDQGAVARIVEHGSRLVDSQSYLSTQFGAIKDLTIESDYIARKNSSPTIKRIHVEEAIDKKHFRHNLYEHQLLSQVKSSEILLSFQGTCVGQVNGLTVLDFGDYSFGKVVRVTVVSSVAEEGIFNVERASRLSGKIHDKGLHICSALLRGLLAQHSPMGMSASVCFEQSYGMIDGDSASVTELTGIISSFSKIPVKQNIAMTGSVNQFGEVQPVGGVNEKIEGFYRSIALQRKTKEPYIVILPIQNINDLMLHQDVVKAVTDKVLKIIPVKYFYEVFEIATGVALGAKSVHQTSFEKGSALEIIRQKMKTIKAEKKKKPTILDSE